MNPELQLSISGAISEATGGNFKACDCQAQSGGCINETWILSDGEIDYFAKLNSTAKLSMFEAEASALRDLAEAKAIRIPRPITHGLANGRSFLVLEALPLGAAKPGSWKAMGQELARLHRHRSEAFGWHRDNTIGSTPQHNKWTDGWPTYFREQRLRPQFDLAANNGYRFEKAGTLLDSVESLLSDHSPAPSLLHGDLWSGNVGFLENGTPVIFDPASYYGDRETDLAFSEFFGGFPDEFHRGYNEEWPLPPGYEKRKTLYNLYHVLNHANLFGGDYPGQAASMIKHILGTN